MRGLLNDASGNARAGILSIYGVLLVFNIGTWLWAILAFSSPGAARHSLPRL